MNNAIQIKKEFYTLESREESRFSEFKKKFRLYTKDGKFLPSARYVYDKEPCPTTTGLSFNLEYNASPRAAQEHIINVIKRRREEYMYWCWLIILGTGKWKSHVAMQIATYFQAPTLILCHNIKTLEEMVAKFKEFTNITPWVYYGKKKNIKEITITTHDSFTNEEWKIWSFDVIIYDECDVSLNKNMFIALAESWAKYLYGMTGTPYRKEFLTQDMEIIFWKRIFFQEEEKYNIVPSRVTVYRYKSEEPYIYENWAEQREAMYKNKHRLEYQLNIINHHHKTWNACLVLTERTEEAYNITQWLINIWINAWVITGETNTKKDSELIALAEEGKIKVIVWTTWKVARWVDIPIIDTIFLFAAVHFEWTIVQAVWRALRLHPKKKRVEIIDFSDDECSSQRYQRVKAYKSEYGLDDSKIFKIKPPKYDTSNRLHLN